MFYSKKPRKVGYRPYSYSDYSAMHEKLQHQGIARLGPDLENDKVKSAKEHRERMLSYAKEIRKTNTEAIKQQKSSPPKRKLFAIVDGKTTYKAEEESRARRDRAREYAATHVPRPITRAKSTEPLATHPGQSPYAFGSTQRMAATRVSPHSREKRLDHLPDACLSPSARLAAGRSSRIDYHPQRGDEGMLTMDELTERHVAEMAAVDSIMAEFA